MCGVVRGIGIYVDRGPLRVHNVSMKEKQLAEGRRIYQQRARAGLIERLDPVQKSRANPHSLRLAINARCFQCAGGRNWHNRTKFCIVFICALWPVRRGAKDVTHQQCLEWGGQRHV